MSIFILFQFAQLIVPYPNASAAIVLVQRLLQHSSAATTQRYIGMEPQRIEAAIQGHTTLL